MIKITSNCCCFSVLVCFSLNLAAQSNGFIFPKDNIYQIPANFAELEIVSLQAATYYLPDPENRLSPTNILQVENHSQFQPEPTLLHHLEMSNGSYWFRVKIIGNLSKQQEYSLNYPSPYTRINVYELQDSQLTLWDQSGFNRQAGRTFSRLGNDNIRLLLRPGEEKVFYIHCREGMLPFVKTFHHISLAPYEKAYARQLMVWGYTRLPIVILTTLIIYHLILFINLRRRLYLYMAFMLLGWLINGPDSTIIIYQSFSAIQHFGMSNLEFGVMVWVIMMLGILFFAREILDLKQHLPKWDWVIKVLIFLCLLNFGLTFLNRARDLAGNLYPGYFIGLPLRVSLSATIAISCMIVSFFRWRQGSNSAPWFLIAVSAPLIFLVANFSYKFIQPNSELLQVFNVQKTFLDNLSFATIVFFIAVSLSERIKDMDRERIDSQLNRSLALAESNRLKELNTAKSRLYTNITHEFRTPLTVIQGLTEQIQEHELEKEMIHRNSQQLLNLVNQMLELSKSEAGMLKLNLIYGSPLSFLRYITESFHALAHHQKINLDFACEEEVPEMDYDPEKVLRILTNLMANAIKFTPEYGMVLVAVKTIKTSSTSDILEIKVKDTGIGITPDRTASIFGRFYQVDDSLIRRREGTGIGLALVKELVELMDGQISVESEIQKGSTFKVLLPIRHTMKGSEAPDPYLSIDAKPTQPVPHLSLEKAKNDEVDKPNLLIVEDNRDVMHYIMSCVKDDFNLQFAFNGKQGIDKALETIPDIIISDIMMPEKDGFELCATLKQDERTDHIPIILLTARANMESKLEGLAHGADAYLIKPFSQQELNIRLHKLLELRKKLQQKYAQQTLPSKVDQALPIESAFLNKAHQVILDQLTNENFTIESLAQALHFSRTHLYRKIKALTGKSTTQFINEIRLKMGRQILLTTNTPISEIAYGVGFQDPAYFTRLFTEYYGKSPSQLRRELDPEKD